MTDRPKEEIVSYTADESARIGSAIVTAANENASEFGKKLVAMATEREQGVFMETVLNRVKELVSHLNNLQIADEKLHREMALFQKRIDAIKAGEFTLGNDGRLSYNDILLNY